MVNHSSIFNFSTLHNFFNILIFTLLGGCAYQSSDPNLDTRFIVSKSEIRPVVLIIRDRSLVQDKNNIFDFYYLDSVFEGHPLLIKADTTRLLLNSSTFLIQADNLQTPFFVHPGDTLRIKKNKSNELLFYNERDEVKTKELSFFRELAHKTGPFSIQFANLISFINQKSKDLSEFDKNKKKILNALNTRLAYLDSSLKENAISTEFFKIGKSIITYDALNNLLLLCWRDRQILEKSNAFHELLKKYVDTLSVIEFSTNYLCYRTLNNAVSIATTKFIENNILDSSDFKTKFNFIQATFKGESKDFLLSCIINRAVIGNVAIPLGYIEQFKIDCTDTTYRNLISIIIEESKENRYLKGSSLLLAADNSGKKDIQDIFFDLKGRIVLVDFWASWCAPCRLEMPYSKILETKFIEKQFSIIYVSTDRQKSDWFKANAEEKLNGKNSFLFLDPLTSIFIKKNNIGAIPRYMILGKDGKILNSDAPRPSDPKLKELIAKYLSQ